MIEKHWFSTYISGHCVKASVVDISRTSLMEAIGTKKKVQHMMTR